MSCIMRTSFLKSMSINFSQTIRGFSIDSNSTKSFYPSGRLIHLVAERRGHRMVAIGIAEWHSWKKPHLWVCIKETNITGFWSI